MGNTLRLHADFVDYALVVVYFAVVLLIGVAARRRMPSSCGSCCVPSSSSTSQLFPTMTARRTDRPGSGTNTPDQSRTVTGTRWTRLLAMPCRFHSCSTGWVPPASSVARASSSTRPGAAVQA